MDKRSIIDWLKKNHRTRDWLAKKCHVKRRTIDNWLVSPQPIPAKSKPIIAALMQHDADQQRLDTVLPQNLVLEFTRRDFDAICDRAISEGQRPNQWAEEQLRSLANEDIEELANRLAAEDQATFDTDRSIKPSGDLGLSG